MGFLGSHTDDVKPVVNATQVGVDPALLAQQQSFANALQQQMAGNGPSVSGAMLNNATQQNAANAMGMAASQRGINPGLAMRQALQGNANANQNAAAQAVVGRNQEQLNASGLLGNQLNGMQTQNLQAQSANQNANTEANKVNAGIATGNTQTDNQVKGGLLKGIGGMFGMAHGGPVEHLASGGAVGDGSNPYGTGSNPFGDSPNPYSGAFNGFFPKMPSPGGGGGGTAMAGGPMDAGGAGGMEGMISQLGPMALLASKGGNVPGQASVPGDSYANDTVPTMLSPGEVVIPRSVVHSPGFMDALQAHVSKLHGEAKGFAQVLAARKGRA